MNIATGAKLLKVINGIAYKYHDSKEVLDACQLLESCVMSILMDFHPGEDVVNLINTYNNT